MTRIQVGYGAIHGIADRLQETHLVILFENGTQVDMLLSDQVGGPLRLFPEQALDVFFNQALPGFLVHVFQHILVIESMRVCNGAAFVASKPFVRDPDRELNKALESLLTVIG